MSAIGAGRAIPFEAVAGIQDRTDCFAVQRIGISQIVGRDRMAVTIEETGLERNRPLNLFAVPTGFRDGDVGMVRYGTARIASRLYGKRFIGAEKAGTAEKLKMKNNDTMPSSHRCRVAFKRNMRGNAIKFMVFKYASPGVTDNNPYRSQQSSSCINEMRHATRARYRLSISPTLATRCQSVSCQWLTGR